MPLGNWNVWARLLTSPGYWSAFITLPSLYSARKEVETDRNSPDTCWYVGARNQMEHTRLAGWVRQPLVWLGIHWRSTEQPTFITRFPPLLLLLLVVIVSSSKSLLTV